MCSYINSCTSTVADMRISFKPRNLLSASRSTVRRKSEKRSRSWISSTWNFSNFDFFFYFVVIFSYDDVGEGSERGGSDSRGVTANAAATHEGAQQHTVRAKSEQRLGRNSRLEADLGEIGKYKLNCWVIHDTRSL